MARTQQNDFVPSVYKSVQKSELPVVKGKILLISNSAWNLFNFRAGLIRAFHSEGYQVVVAAPPDPYTEMLVGLPCRYIPLPFNPTSLNPLSGAALFCRCVALLMSERPLALCTFTIKPNVFASVAANVCGVSVINNISGLGTVFGGSGWLKRFVLFLYAIALRRSKTVFFQNNDDRETFLREQVVSEGAADLLPGSGVNLAAFPLMPLPVGRVIRFLLVGRMLWDKGIGEFAAAALILKKRGIAAECCLLGFMDVDNPGAIPRKDIVEWEECGAVRYLGAVADVRKEISRAHCIVLPSFYREGVPKSLLEAASMGRPVVASDSVGCREVVDDGVTGLLCRTRDANDLADKMEEICRMSDTERTAMGLLGRSRVERMFDERYVVNKYLASLSGSQRDYTEI